ncbi:hypothetical protein N9123_00315 [Pseudomonadales bacterium]|nr:hypothetical protein [Pseudomonadales bacterium]
MTVWNRKAYSLLRQALNSYRLNKDHLPLYSDKVNRDDSLSIVDFQNLKLSRLLKHAYQHVPYYQRLFQAAGLFDISDIDHHSLKCLPILTKALVKDNFDDLIARNFESSSLIDNSTSGSSGTPFYFKTDKQSLLMRERVVIKNHRWLGVEPHSKKAWLWGASMDFKKSPATTIKNYFSGSLMLSSNQVCEHDYKRYADALAKFKPSMLISYPSSLLPFADYCERHGRVFSSIKKIITSAETLYSFQREKIETVFSAPIFNRYGCREVGDIAHELPGQKGMRVNADHVFLELVDDSGNIIEHGEGDLLVTDLDCYGMPLLRYQIGDSGELASQNGNDYPVLRSLSGRSLDVVRAPNGVILGGTYWTMLMRNKPGIEQFQIIQDDINKVMISYKKGGDFNSDLLSYVSQQLHEKTASTLTIEFEEVAGFEATNNGKFRLIESKI